MPQLLDVVDRRAAKEKTTRSAIMEQWLRSASRQAELQRLEEETAAYYDALTPGRKGRRRGVGRIRVAIGPEAHHRRARTNDVAAPFATELIVQRRGHIYWAEMDKRRPVLVVSIDARNERANDVIVVPCSTTLREAPTHVRLARGEGGLPRDSVLKCEQITTLKKDDVDPAALWAAALKTRTHGGGGTCRLARHRDPDSNGAAGSRGHLVL